MLFLFLITHTYCFKFITFRWADSIHCSLQQGTHQLGVNRLSNNKMGEMYVIITTRNILWMVLSLAAALAVITGIMTPKWLYGSAKPFVVNSTEEITSDLLYQPSIGIYNRCRKIQRSIGGDPELNCYKYARSFMEIPSAAWRACLFFLCLGAFLLGVVALMSLIGFCVQSVGRKSIFSLGGVIQAMAGNFTI